MGDLRFAQQRYDEAEKSYQQALDREAGSTEALAGLMKAYVGDKHPEKAIAAAARQVAVVPTSGAFYDLLGTALLNEGKDLEGAEAALRKASELDSNNVDALLKLGELQATHGRDEEALATWLNASRTHPHESGFLILTGELYERRQEWDRAKQAYQKALEISPNDALASNNLAYVMLESGGNVDVALALAQTARREMPDSPNAADTLGWVFYKKGVYGSAIDLFQDALKLTEKAKAPDNPTVHYHLALAYEKVDKRALAREHFERVLKIDPNYSQAAEVRRQLAQLAL
jgi:tetratricopeptide (TPR) repeat protein